MKKKDVEQPEMEVFSGQLVEVPFINKGGRLIEGVSSLFLQTETDKYFIKLYEGDVLLTDLKKQLNKPLKVKGYKRFGLWDSDDPNVQSRVGNYVAIFEILD